MSNLVRPAIEAFLLHQMQGYLRALRSAQMAARWQPGQQTYGMVAYYHHAVGVCKKMLADVGYDMPQKEIDSYATVP